MNALTVVLGVVFLNFAAATEYTTCSSEYGEVESVTVSDCGSSPCILKVGTNPEIVINFKSLVDSKTLNAKIFGVIANVPLPFPNPHTNACENSGITCPLEKSKAYTYKNSFEVKSAYPRIPVVVKYTLVNENNQEVVCIKIPSRIES